MRDETEKELLRFCGMVWEKTYKTDESDMKACEFIYDANRKLVLLGEDGHTDSEVLRIWVTTKWIHCGCPKLVTDAKYAAAMMCTKVTTGLSEDIIIPWKAFRVDLPPGLLSFGEYTYDHIRLASFDDRAALILEGQRPATAADPPGEEWIHSGITRMASDMATLLLDDEAESFDISEGLAVGRKDADPKLRTLRLAVRLVVGLLYTMQHTAHFKSQPKSLNDSRRSLRTGPPGHRTIFVGKPIALDVRPAVRQFCGAGKGGAPSVQTLVRGHYKRQVVGVARGGRKVIWVEPYWRGPEDAPILARPHMVKAATEFTSATEPKR
jgi:hypothetical protein